MADYTPPRLVIGRSDDRWYRATDEAAKASGATEKAFGRHQLAEFDALGVLVATNRTAWLFAMGLWIVLVSIDAAPVVAKLAAGEGSYDVVVAAEEAKVLARERTAVAYYSQMAEPLMLDEERARHGQERAHEGVRAQLHALVAVVKAAHLASRDFDAELAKLVQAANALNDPEAAQEVERLLRDLRARFSQARGAALDRFAAAMRRSES